MTKTEARRWLKEARAGLRDIGLALDNGDADQLAEGLLFASAAPEEIRVAFEAGELAGFRD